MTAKTILNSSSTPRYRLGLNPPYQVDYCAKRSGRHFSVTKRRVTFKFGYSDASAIVSGRRGPDCRGEEHEVVLIWSHLTGKRQVLLDGNEVHTSKGSKGNMKFQHSWSMLGSHEIKLTANASQSAAERQFELLLDGQSYFDFASIYRLGCGGRGGGTSKLHVYENVSNRTPVSQARIAAADNDASFSTVGSASIATGSASSIGGIDFLVEDSADIEPPIKSYVGSSDPFSASCGGAFFSAGVYTTDQHCKQLAPVRPSFDSISNEIMSAYGSGSRDIGGDHYHSSSTSLQKLQQQLYLANVPFTHSQFEQRDGASPTSVLQDPSRLTVEEKQINELTEEMHRLVNLDDITDKPFALNRSDPASPASTKNTGNKSRGLPPVDASMGWNIVGRTPTLAEIQSAKQKNPSPAFEMEVMKKDNMLAR